MNRLVVYLFFFGIVANASKADAQILKPVHWAYGAKRVSTTEAIVFLKAAIDEGWHLYSQHVPEGGPVKTTFAFSTSKNYTLVGTTQEPTPVLRKEKVFGNMEIGFFEHSVIFQQKVKLKSGETVVNGKLEFMTCNDSQCLAPETIEFSIPVK